MPIDTEIRDLVKRVVGRVLAERGNAAHPTAAGTERRPAGVHVTTGAPRPGDGPASRAGGGRGRALVTADCLAETPDGGCFAVPDGAIVTPLASEEAERRGVALVRASEAPAGPPGGAGAGAESTRQRVAVGCDHGGFALKLDVLEWIRQLGHHAVDLGTHDENPVDYPDTALAVAEAVAAGRCDLGVCIDGAGIGSAMAANKVPGVRAANGYDVASVQNAREHNYANVLTLGGRRLSRGEAFDCLRAFLSTPWGAERHGRRVQKITAIERRWARDPRREARA